MNQELHNQIGQRFFTMSEFYPLNIKNCLIAKVQFGNGQISLRELQQIREEAIKEVENSPVIPGVPRFIQWSAILSTSTRDVDMQFIFDHLEVKEGTDWTVLSDQKFIADTEEWLYGELDGQTDQEKVDSYFSFIKDLTRQERVSERSKITLQREDVVGINSFGAQFKTMFEQKYPEVELIFNQIPLDHELLQYPVPEEKWQYSYIHPETNEQRFVHEEIHGYGEEHCFTSYVTKKPIQTLGDIRFCEAVDSFKRFHPFTCWECGIRKETLEDLFGSNPSAEEIVEAWEAYKDHYCGC